MKVLSPCTVTFALPLFALFLLVGESPGQAQQPKLVRIGVVDSIVQDLSPPEAKAVLVALNSLIQAQVGIPCRSAIVKDAWELGKQLKAGELDVGVLTGFEFAWIQERYPKLRPLANPVVGKHPRPMAFLVVRRDSPVTNFADLKGQQIAQPVGCRPEAALFLKQAEEKDKGFKVCRSASIQGALDEVILGKVPAAVVDDVGLAAYTVVKPGCAKRLKIIQHSPTFPAGVIVYREGALDQNTLRRFHKGLLGAHRDPRNRILMSLFHLSSFEPVPADYQQALASSRKSFPARDDER